MRAKRVSAARCYVAQKSAARHFFAALLLLFAPFLTEAVLAAGMLDTVVSTASTSSSGWMNQSLEFAKNLFFGLAALEFAWAAIQLTLQKGEVSDLAVGLLMKVVAIGFFSMLLIKAPDWIPKIIDSFKSAGAAVGNSNYGTSGVTNMATCASGTISPSAVLDQGLCVASKLTTVSLEKMGIEDGSPDLVDVIANFFPMLMLGLASIATLLGFVVLAVQLAITLIESYIVIGGGALMLGFLGSRWTMSYGERFFGYAVSVGVKLFTLYLIVALGESFVNALVNYIANDIQSAGTISINTLLGTVGGSLSYGAIGYLVPGLAGTMLNGSPSLSMSNVGQAGKGIATAPISAGLSTGAAGARALGLGSAAAAFLMSKFGGGGGGGGIGGTPPGGGGGGGSVLGNFDSGRTTPVPKPGDTGSGTVPSPAGGAIPSPIGRAGSKAGPSGVPAGSYDRQSAADQTPAGNVPGFQSPRSMGADRRERDVMLGGGGYSSDGDGRKRKEPSKLDKFSRAMNNLAREMQYASHRHHSGMGHDGNTGSAPGARLNI